MIILPAIDIRGGRAVRLTRGEYDNMTVYSDDPVAVARGFADAGARNLHVVDLDGALSGETENYGIIRKIISATGMSVEVGGGKVAFGVEVVGAKGEVAGAAREDAVGEEDAAGAVDVLAGDAGVLDGQAVGVGEAQAAGGVGAVEGDGRGGGFAEVEAAGLDVPVDGGRLRGSDK